MMVAIRRAHAQTISVELVTPHDLDCRWWRWSAIPMPARAPCSTCSPARARRSAIIPASRSSANRGGSSLPDGRPVELVDLPGAYSLDASSPDEEVTRDVVLGKQDGERLPDALAGRARRDQSRQSPPLRACRLHRARPADGDRAQHDRSSPSATASTIDAASAGARARRAGDRDGRGPPPRASRRSRRRSARGRSSPAAIRAGDGAEDRFHHRAAPRARDRQRRRRSRKRRPPLRPTAIDDDRAPPDRSARSSSSRSCS